MASRRLLAALVVASLGAAGPAFAQPSASDRETARSLMDEGRSLREHKDMRAALDRFQRADEIMHVPTTAYEVARTQAGMGQMVEALDTIARILHTPVGPREPGPFRAARKNAQALEDSLTGRVPGLTISVTGVPQGETATVTVDDVDINPAALGIPKRVNPGHHVVAATTHGASGRAEVDVQDGETKDVSVPLVTNAPVDAPKASPDAEPTVNEAPTPIAHGGSHPLAYAGFGAAGGGLIVGMITGAMTLSTKGSLSHECNGSKECPPSAYGDLNRANTLATTSTIAFAAAGVGAIVGVVGLFVGGKSQSPPPEAAFVPWIGPGMAGLTGRF